MTATFWAISARNDYPPPPSMVLQDHFNNIRKLAKEGIIKPVIDRFYPLEQIVEAHRHVDTGRKRGNVVIEVSGYIMTE